MCSSAVASSTAAVGLAFTLLLLLLLATLQPCDAVLRSAAPLPTFFEVGVPDVTSFGVTTAGSTAADQQMSATPIGFFPSVYSGIALPISDRPDFGVDMPVMLPHKLDVLMQQSQCTDARYAYVAMSGARGIIIYNCPPDAPWNCEVALQSTLIRIAMPSVTLVSITYANGRKIVDYLHAKQAAADPIVGPPRNSLVFTTKSSGPIASDQRDALIKIANRTMMQSFALTPALDILPLWSVPLFTNMSLDPCRDRVKGIWCEGNDIVIISIFYHLMVTPYGIPSDFGRFTELRYLASHVNAWEGPLPPSFCNLSKLRGLRVSQQQRYSATQKAPMISSIPNCAWPEMEEFVVFANVIPSLPSNLSNWPKLRLLKTSTNKLTALPGLTTLQKLEFFDASQNALTGGLPAFHPSAPLSVMAIGTNQLSGNLTASQFDFMPSLTIIDINTNRFQGPLPTLNGTTNLQILDLSSQRDLTNPNSIGMYGDIPTRYYTALQSLTTLNLQENSLIMSPSLPIYTSRMLQLKSVDLSYNLLQNAPQAGFPDGIMTRTLGLMMGPSLTTVRLNNNKFAGIFGVADVTAYKNVQKIYLQNNFVTTMWAEMFTLASLIVLDVSYNNISSVAPTFQSTPPIPTFESLNLVGNPSFTIDFPMPWVTASTSRVQTPGSKYACSTLGAISSMNMVLNVDPGLFLYKYCVCTAGTFGKAPLCSAVPNNADMTPYSTISSAEVGDTFATLIQQTGGAGSQPVNMTGLDQTKSIAAMGYSNPKNTTTFSNAFSDSMYGDNRLTLGLSTSWVIDVTHLYAENPDPYTENGQSLPDSAKQIYVVDDNNSPETSWTPVRVITVRLHLSAALFTSFDDSISIFSGGSDLRGERYFTIRGSDTKPPMTSSPYTETAEYQLLHGASIAKVNDSRLIEIQVYSATAAVQYTSRQTGGLNFYATYSYDFNCPQGYFYDTVSDPAMPRCQPNYLIHTVDSGVRSAVFAVSTISLVLIIITIFILLLNWENSVWKAASRSFMLLTLILMILMSLGAMLYAAIPDLNKHAVCIGRAWLTCLPVSGILSIMLAKNRRMWAIFGTTKLQVKVHSDLDLLTSVLIISGLQCIMLFVFSGMPLSKATFELGNGSYSRQLVTSCSQERGFWSWIGVEIAFLLLLMLPNIYLGFKTRNLPSQFNESSHLQNALIILLFFGVIIVPLAALIQNDPAASVIIQGLGLAVCCLVLWGIIFLPKIYYTVSARDVKGGATQSGGGIPMTDSPPGTGTQSLSQHHKKNQSSHGDRLPPSSGGSVTRPVPTNTVPRMGQPQLSSGGGDSRQDSNAPLNNVPTSSPRSASPPPAVSPRSYGGGGNQSPTPLSPPSMTASPAPTGPIPTTVAPAIALAPAVPSRPVAVLPTSSSPQFRQANPPKHRSNLTASSNIRPVKSARTNNKNEGNEGEESDEDDVPPPAPLQSATPTPAPPVDDYVSIELADVKMASK